MDVFEFFGHKHAAEEALGKEIAELVKAYADKLAAETGIAVGCVEVRTEVAAMVDRALPRATKTHYPTNVKVNFKMELS